MFVRFFCGAGGPGSDCYTGQGKMLLMNEIRQYIEECEFQMQWNDMGLMVVRSNEKKQNWF